MGPQIPPADDWTPADDADTKDLLDTLEDLATLRGGAFTPTSELLHEALAEVCNPRLTPDTARGAFWRPYRDCSVDLRSFFLEWLTFAPNPKDPGAYIAHWDHLANTEAGRQLHHEVEAFKRWFVRFLNLRGRWLNSTNHGLHWGMAGISGHARPPLDIGEFVIPMVDFSSTSSSCVSFSLDGAPTALTRTILAPRRPAMAASFSPRRYLGGSYTLPGKSGDTFSKEAVPGFEAARRSTDILLWFTDYHHFHAPVSAPSSTKVSTKAAQLRLR